MQPSCNCGALLPDDARFCHKCGKPQFEEDIARLSVEDTAPAPLPPPSLASSTASSRIGFSNMRAVGITLAVAALSLVALIVSGMVAPILGPIVLCGAGFAAARFYRSRTTEPLTPFGGATLGIMTGFWLFLVMAICTALASLYLSTPDGPAMLRNSIPNMPNGAAVAKMLDDPHGFLMSMLAQLIVWFFLATISAAFGGMLAARLQTKGGQSS